MLHDIGFWVVFVGLESSMITSPVIVGLVDIRYTALFTWLEPSSPTDGMSETGL